YELKTVSKPRVSHLSATTLVYLAFPYTTLFRSGRSAPAADRPRDSGPLRSDNWCAGARATRWYGPRQCQSRLSAAAHRPPAERRSEEHTSELQSRENLVCRLLLEKKNDFTTKNK